MSSTSKWIVWIIIIIAIVYGGYWYMKKYKAPAKTQEIETNSQATTTATQVTGVTLSTGLNDASDSALDKDAATLDQEIKGLSADLDSVDQSLNDQPIQ